MNLIEIENMSKNKTKKKVVVTTKKADKQAPVVTNAPKKKIKPTTSRQKNKLVAQEKANLTFGKQNYILMGIGIVLVFAGILLMSGGSMPSPEIWDENIIYSFRRTVLAPFTIVAGLIVEIFAIFKGYKIEE